MSSPKTPAFREVERLPRETLLNSSNAAIARYVKAHLGSDKLATSIPVAVSKAYERSQKDDFRNRFIETTYSCRHNYEDLRQIDKALYNIIADPDKVSSRFEPDCEIQWVIVTPPTNELQGRIYREVAAYYDLVGDGGRPAYPIEHLADVAETPKRFNELWCVWGKDSASREVWEVYQRQLKRWGDFRKWQRHNRHLPDELDGGFPAYVNQQRPNRHPPLPATVSSEIESSLRRDWEAAIKRREFLTQEGCGEFADYVHSARRRLAQHSITHHLGLKEDMDEQDPLTTWMEYANFEMWRLEQRPTDVQVHQRAIDEAFSRLGNIISLEPHETPESVRIGLEDFQEERREADDAYFTRGDADPEKRKAIEERDAETRRRAFALADRHEAIENFIDETSADRRKIAHRAQHQRLVQWILEQIPLVEAESAMPPPPPAQIPPGDHEGATDAVHGGSVGSQGHQTQQALGRRFVRGAAAKAREALAERYTSSGREKSAPSSAEQDTLADAAVTKTRLTNPSTAAKKSRGSGRRAARTMSTTSTTGTKKMTKSKGRSRQQGQAALSRGTKRKR